MKSRSAKVYKKFINGLEYEYIKVRDRNGDSRRKYKRICSQCGKDDWLGVSWIKNNQKRCRECAKRDSPTEETRRKISESLRVKFNTPSYKEMFKYKNALLGKKKRGENHWNWKGGISDENQKFRNSAEYKEWRELVYKRDLYHCRVCNKNTSDLNAHHIKPFYLFPEMRTDINNGLTLCKECHNLVHKYYMEVAKNG